MLTFFRKLIKGEGGIFLEKLIKGEALIRVSRVEKIPEINKRTSPFIRKVRVSVHDFSSWTLLHLLENPNFLSFNKIFEKLCSKHTWSASILNQNSLNSLNIEIGCWFFACSLEFGHYKDHLAKKWQFWPNKGQGRHATPLKSPI